MSNNKVKLGLYITGREYMKTFRVIRDMVEKLLPNGEIKVTTPDMQDLERTVAELRHALEVERRGHHNRRDQLEGADQTIATQKRVIEMLLENWDGPLGMAVIQSKITAIENGEL